MSAQASAGHGRRVPCLKVIDGGGRESARRIEVLEEFVVAQALACGPSSYARRLDALEFADRPRFAWPAETDKDDEEYGDDDNGDEQDDASEEGRTS